MFNFFFLLTQLEYTLDFTKEGYNQQSREHNYYGDSSYSGQTGRSSEEGSSFVGIFIVMLACCLVIYALYKTCIAPSEPVFQSRLAHRVILFDYYCYIAVLLIV